MLRCPPEPSTVTSNRTTLDDLMAYIAQPAWHRSALCRRPEYSSMPWVPPRGVDIAPMLAVCACCPVRSECLDAAIAAGERGVWGGTSGRERLQLRKVQRQQHRAA